MQKIMDTQQNLLVIYMRLKDWTMGLDFITEDSQSLQVGTWFYPKGKKLDRHQHNLVERKTNITQECVTLLAGSMKVGVYDLSRAYVTEFIMQAGDFAIFLQGGHEYEILEDDTRVLETKNGPFLGVDIDKTRF